MNFFHYPYIFKALTLGSGPSESLGSGPSTSDVCILGGRSKGKGETPPFQGEPTPTHEPWYLGIVSHCLDRNHALSSKPYHPAPHIDQMSAWGPSSLPLHFPSLWQHLSFDLRREVGAVLAAKMICPLPDSML